MNPAIYLIICSAIHCTTNAKEAAEEVEKIARKRGRARWKA